MGTYNQVPIYTEQGGSKKVFKSGAEQEMQSGAFFDMQDGSLLKFDASAKEVSASQARVPLYDRLQQSVIGQGAASTKFSVVNLPNYVGVVFLSMTSTLVSASFWLRSCELGEDVWIFVRSGSVGSGQIDVSCSGCSIIGLRGSSISGFELHNSAASAPAVHLRAIADNQWAVLETRGNYVE